MADPWHEEGAMRFVGRDGPRLAFEAEAGPGRAYLTLLEDDVVRLQWRPSGQVHVPRTWAVVGRGGDVPREGRERDDLSVFACPEARVEERSDGLVLQGPGVRVEVTKAPFALRWCLPDGTPLLCDHPELAYRHAGVGRRGVRHTLRRDPEEVYLGLGEASGPLDRHHRRFRLWPGDALGYDAERSDPLYKHLPFVTTLTRDGHAVGLLYDTGAQSVFDLGCEIDHYDGPFRYAELRARELDLYVLVGPGLPEVVRRLQDLTGYAPLAPRWTLGYLGSTMRYTDAEDPSAAFEGFVRELRHHQIGCSGFQLSSGYSLGDDGRRYVFVWNRRRVPDPGAMLAPLQRAGIRTIANVKPALLTRHPEYDELASRGAFVLAAPHEPAGTEAPDAEPAGAETPDAETPRASGSARHAGTPHRDRFWGGQASFLDFTNPVAYDWWRQRLRERLLEVGVDASWNDNNEYRIGDDAARCAAGEVGDLRPTLALLMNHASRTAQRQARPEARDFQVSRSGGLGMQRYAQTWSGDNATSWHTLAYNLPMGLSMSLSGWANHGHDVGGLTGPMPDAELLVRWVEQGVCMPRFTIHSWNDDGSATEPWSHPEVLPLVRRLMGLRTALVPYLATLQRASCERGEPLTRPLAYAFQGWRPGWRESFVHTLGEALLVAPVLAPNVRERELLLPPGRWLELATGRVWSGDQQVSLDAPLGTLPLLLREGCALPLAEHDPGADDPAPAWLAGGAGVAPPSIQWLAFPDATGKVAGSLVWDDGVSRAHEGGAFDRFELGGGLDDGVFVPTLHVRQAASGCGVGRHEVLLPGGDLRLPWFASGWARRAPRIRAEGGSAASG